MTLTFRAAPQNIEKHPSVEAPNCFEGAPHSHCCFILIQYEFISKVSYSTPCQREKTWLFLLGAPFSAHRELAVSFCTHTADNCRWLFLLVLLMSGTVGAPRCSMSCCVHGLSTAPEVAFGSTAASQPVVVVVVVVVQVVVEDATCRWHFVLRLDEAAQASWYK